MDLALIHSNPTAICAESSCRLRVVVRVPLRLTERARGAAVRTVDVRARTGALALALTLVACGPDEPLEPAELEEVCGEPSPFRVLELPAGEHALPGFSVMRVDDRILWLVGDADFVPSTHEHGYQPPEHTTLWSTGPCGQSPVVVAEDLDALFVNAETWPDHVLACDTATGDVLVLDPEGVRSPHVVASNVACGTTWTEHGIFATTAARDDGTASLVFHPLAVDPWEPPPAPVVLVDSLRPDRYRLARSASHDTFAVRGDELFALQANGELVTIDLIDGDRELERTDVFAFDLSADARWLLWQDAPTSTDDPHWAPGNVSLTDRSTGTTTLLAQAELSSMGLQSEDSPSHLRLVLGKYFGDPTLVVLLPSLEMHVVPEGRWVNGPIEDGARWLVSATKPNTLDTTQLLYDIEDGSETLLFDGDGFFDYVDDGLELLEISMWIDEQAFDQGELWHVPFDGTPELRAHRSSMHRFDLGDDRMITTLDIHGDWVGDLVVVDHDTLEERLVDSDVFAYSPRYNERDRFPDDAVAYVVDDGDRSGIWLARLAPP